MEYVIKIIQIITTTIICSISNQLHLSSSNVTAGSRNTGPSDLNVRALAIVTRVIYVSVCIDIESDLGMRPEIRSLSERMTETCLYSNTQMI